MLIVDCLQYCNWSEAIFRDMREGVMPAPCYFSCSQAVVRIAPIIVPSGPRDLVTRLLHGSYSRLPWRLMGRLDMVECPAGGLDSRGLEGLQPSSWHRLSSGILTRSTSHWG